MKLDLVTETFPPEINGVAMTLQRLVSGLAERGHEVTVIRPRQGRDDEACSEPYQEWLVPGCPIPRYPGLHFGFPASGKLRREWSERRPDIIHVATEGPLGVSAVCTARNLRIPATSSFHTNFHSYGKHYGYGPLLQAVYGYLRWVHNQTTCTLAPSEDLVAELKEDGFVDPLLLGRGVDTRLFSPSKRDIELRKSWGADDDTPVVIYVGRIAGEKNLPLSVECYQQLRKQREDAKMVLVGDGPERAKLAKKHPELIFVGPKRGEELARHFASGDLFLFASITETFGNVVTEAMASGVLVVAYDYAAPLKYIRHGQNGFTVPYDDADAFREACAGLIKRESQWAELRAAARKTAEGISWDTIIDGLETLMLDTIDEWDRIQQLRVQRLATQG